MKLKDMPQEERMALGAAFGELIRAMWNDPEERERFERSKANDQV